MPKITGQIIVTVSRPAPPTDGGEGHPSAAFLSQGEREEVSLPGSEFGLEEGDGEGQRRLQGVFVAFGTHGVRAEVSVDVQARGAFLDPVDISEDVVISSDDREWTIVDTVRDLQVEFA